VVGYVLIKKADGGTSTPERPPVLVIGWSVAAMIAFVCGLTWLVTAEHTLLPRIFLDDVRVDRNENISTLLGGLLVALNSLALALLSFQRRSVLDVWLMVMCCAWLLENILSVVLVDARFSVGWYAGRIYGLIATIVVMVVLLSETTTLYADLARSVQRQRGARQARQVSMDAMAASIAHEISQPLGAIVTNANAGRRWLTKTPPNLDEALLALNRIATDGNRAAGVIRSLRAMFKKSAHGRVSFNVNDLVREVIDTLEIDLRTQQVSVSSNLNDGIPLLLGDRGQLHQVFLNLMVNAIEAMGTVTDRARVLGVTSNTIQGFSGVIVTIEDSGTGIEGEEKDRIFEPFFTTKAGGTGIGLAICRSIVEAHEGSLGASAKKPYGAIFRVALPTATDE
jgi:signal transduction histidine kinase